MIVDPLSAAFDRNTLSHVKVCETFYRSLDDVLKPLRSAQNSPQSDFIDVGNEWFMQVDRNELAFEASQLKQIHKEVFTLSAEYQKLCPNSVGFVVTAPNETENSSIRLKILPFKIDSIKLAQLRGEDPYQQLEQADLDEWHPLNFLDALTADLPQLP